MKILNILDHLLQTGSDGKSTATWIGTVEHIEDNGLVRWIFKISLHHSQLIKVCEQSKIICSHNRSPFFVNNNVSLSGENYY